MYNKLNFFVLSDYIPCWNNGLTYAIFYFFLVWDSQKLAITVNHGQGQSQRCSMLNMASEPESWVRGVSLVCLPVDLVFPISSYPGYSGPIRILVQEEAIYAYNSLVTSVTENGERQLSTVKNQSTKQCSINVLFEDTRAGLCFTSKHFSS